MIKNKYSLSDSDHYMRSLKAALIDEDNYFDNLLGNDISAIAKNLRELHKKDSNTGSNDTVFDEFMDTCEEVQKADSITQKQMLTYSKLFQMNFTKMDPYEFKTLGILCILGAANGVIPFLPCFTNLTHASGAYFKLFS